MEIETLTRKWGNSIAIILPARAAEQEKIKENERVVAKIEKKNPLLVKDVFGMLKGKFTKSAQEIKDEMRAGWFSASDRKREEEWKKQEMKK
ncbi:hypothetical protein HYW75_01210 [Candidatus Pacearchaeota archaeon]|nr:hypothetical protein [Candidatus Pacearchaeota archaeon]